MRRNPIIKCIVRLVIAVVVFGLLTLVLSAPLSGCEAAPPGWLLVGLGLFLGAGIALLASAWAMSGLCGSSVGVALGDLLKTIFGLCKGFQRIEDGATVIPKDAKAALLGPMNIVIKGSAVTMYRGAKQTRICGPEFVRSVPWEHVGRIYDLCPNQRVLSFSNVLTLEHMPTTVEVLTVYAISVGGETMRGERKLTDEERAIIQRLDCHTREWKQMTESAIEQEVRRAAARIKVEELLAANSFPRLSQTVLARANLALNPWGLKVHQIIIRSVQPAVEVTQGVNRAYVAQITETARAGTLRDTLRVLADGYRTAKELGMSDTDLQREVLRRILEVLAKDPKLASYPLTAETVRALEELRQSTGSPPGGYTPMFPN